MLRTEPISRNILANILQKMDEIAETTIHYFKEDVLEDKKILRRSKKNQQYIWLVKETGTWLLDLQAFKPSEYLKHFINVELVKKIFLIDTNKNRLKEITKDEALRITKETFEAQYDKLKTNDTVTIHNFKTNETIHYTKLYNNKLLETKETKTNRKRQFKAQQIVTKDFLIQKIKDIYKTIPKSDITLQNIFTQEETNALMDFKTITK